MASLKFPVPGDRAHQELTFRRILVPTDFSAGARMALECARSLAQKLESKIFLIHVIPTDVFELDSPENSRDALAKAREFARQQLNGLKAEGESRGIPHEGILLEGPVWAMISGAIKENNIDLLAVGTHGKANSKKLVLGAVTEELYRMADCPILTVPILQEIKDNQESRFDNLLFATNFKPHNARVATAAQLIESRQKVQLTVLHVIEDSSESSLPSQKLVEDFMVTRMRKILPADCLERCKPDFAVRFGKPVDEILAAAKQLNANLILLGLRAAERTAGHLPSPVAYGIVCLATCPVLTLRQ